MTFTKAAADTEQQEIAKLAKVLFHPARLAILQLLATEKTCISGDISEALPLSRTTVSQHLKELKNANLIIGEIDGLTVCYCLNQPQVERAKQLLENFFGQIESCRNSCTC